jgi:hypothetical protein
VHLVDEWPEDDRWTYKAQITAELWERVKVKTVTRSVCIQEE